VVSRGRARTPVTGTPIDELAETGEALPGQEFEALTPPPVLVDEVVHQLAARSDFSPQDLELARVVAETVALRIGQSVRHAHQMQNDRLLEVAHAAPGSERTAVRLAEIETWRKTEVDPWRLRLTGVDDGNGRLGRMDRRIDDLREDVGTSEQAAATRAGAALALSAKKRLWAALGAAAFALGTAGYGLFTARDQARDAAARAAAQYEVRLQHVERRLEKHEDVLLRRGRMTPAPDNDPRTP
jgi:hypothetical protein